MNDNNWLDLSPHWLTIERLAQKRHNQKEAFESSRHWTKKNNTHFCGLCGEVIVAIKAGLKVDRELRVNGDPGFDFNEDGTLYDVKTSTYWNSPHLKEFTDSNKRPDVYILVALDLNKKRGRVVGWVLWSQLQRAKKRDYKYGPRLSVTESEINGMKQTGLPPKLHKRGTE